MFVFPHGIHVDRDGNVWVTDGAEPAQDGNGKGHQVFKFSPDGKRADDARQGRRRRRRPRHVQPAVATSSSRRTATSSWPTATAATSNARIVKFSKDGKFIKTWGKQGSAPGEFDDAARARHGFAGPRCSSPTAATTASRSSTRTASSSPSGSSSAGRAASSSTRTTCCTSPTHQSDAKTNPGFKRGHPDRQRQGRQGDRLHSGSRASTGRRKASPPTRTATSTAR